MKINTNEINYLCTWNNCEIVEIHTEQSLRNQYKDTPLFNYDNGEFCSSNGLENFLFIQYIEYSKDRKNAKAFAKFIDDNMTIQRIN
tara:strand:+ start:713 stop:973 length:261 start_codon:yes stop_codon:yes gene_type:complete